MGAFEEADFARFVLLIKVAPELGNEVELFAELRYQQARMFLNKRFYQQIACPDRQSGRDFDLRRERSAFERRTSNKDRGSSRANTKMYIERK